MDEVKKNVFEELSGKLEERNQDAVVKNSNNNNNNGNSMSNSIHVNQNSMEMNHNMQSTSNDLSEFLSGIPDIS